MVKLFFFLLIVAACGIIIKKLIWWSTSNFIQWFFFSPELWYSENFWAFCPLTSSYMFCPHWKTFNSSGMISQETVVTTCWSVEDTTFQSEPSCRWAFRLWSELGACFWFCWVNFWDCASAGAGGHVLQGNHCLVL